MATSGATGIEAELRAQLRRRMAARDRVSVQVLRTAIAAIENAGAQPLAPSSSPGDGPTEVDRRTVDEDEARAVVAAELQELLDAASRYGSLGEDAAAARIGEQAAVLRRALGAPRP